MDEKIEKTVAALKKHQFDAAAAGDRGQALEMILAKVPAGARVGVPGSATVRAVGAVEALKQKGHEVYDHWQEGLPLAEVMKVRKLQLTASDVLLTSANAVAMTGELVNMDGFGNRVAPTIYGPARVIIVAGRNKIAPDLAAARDRIRQVAAPLRAKELKVKVPCAETGQCTDCNSPLRLCRAEVILHRPPSMTPITVIIVDEDLGN